MLEARIVSALLDVRLCVGAETVLLTGPNGSGKSSLLRALLGIDKPRLGRIALSGRVLFDGNIDVPPEKRALGYVPQSCALFPHLDVAGNVGFGLGKRERAARTAEVLRALQIEGLASRRVQTLSGGEQQKVALARALARRPQAVLLDEPFAALDAQARKQTRSFVARHLAQLGVPALLVSHHPDDAADFQRIAVMERGRIVQQGTLAELRAAPSSAFVRELAP